ncbi:hypothetical protein TNIN_155071 [Trichonephila inaurata madagascariensis]|uniref:Uncharacterized protein n=1 Tax=Trichonephila inaurata madagascariensis TaxID=2747483 RepID=A0A8X6Y8W3_9ARAC|nr:hypothetical protein TNIN_374271 [Trichonephila inaurata madagascariensis]GFY66736.1 hypothetical protein TNIN_155071 [Trichonephila inaurata madagascariensis]
MAREFLRLFVWSQLGKKAAGIEKQDKKHRFSLAEIDFPAGYWNSFHPLHLLRSRIYSFAPLPPGENVEEKQARAFIKEQRATFSRNASRLKRQ